MDQAMKIPFKVSTTTSNFMIGVTAAASAGIYLRDGYIDPGLAMPVMLGVLAGALIGREDIARSESANFADCVWRGDCGVGDRDDISGRAGEIVMTDWTRRRWRRERNGSTRALKYFLESFCVGECCWRR